MRSVTSITIDAPASRIYEFAHKTDRWPQILPHYRFVHVLSQDGSERTIEMAARRSVFPVRWTAIQRDDPQTPAIYFHHVRGWTRGMDVVWIFEERGPRTHVSIVHDVVFRFPVAAQLIERFIITPFFIEGIAKRTLARMKTLAEGA